MAKILIIDDDEDITESMRLVLESKGYKVISAKDGHSGLEKTQKENPDLIILDVMMPTIDGFEVSRRLKAMTSAKNVPILMLTAIKDRTGFDFKKEAGDETWLPVDDYCEKPLDHDDLLSKIERLLRGPRLPHS